MEQNTTDFKNNCLQQLFDSAVWFDKDKVLNLTRKSAKDIPDKVKREFFKGFSRPDKMASNDLERLFRNFLKNKSKYDISYQVIKRSFFTDFFHSANNLLKTAFFSNFNSTVGERTKAAIALVLDQSGWPANVVNCIATLEPNVFIKYGPSGFGVGTPIYSGIRTKRKAAAPTSQLTAHSRSRDV